MDQLLFGISGLPIGDSKTKYEYSTGIRYLKSLGLDAMELPFVRSVNVSDRNKDKILIAKEENDFYLSAHGSYFINLNAEESIKQEESLERIQKGAKGLEMVGGRSLVFHAGFYLKSSKQDTYNSIRDKLKKLPYFGIDYRLETTGKPTQFGSLAELVDICKEVSTCKLCIDFSHIHARDNGILKSYDDFISILRYVDENLGREAVEDIHIHVSGINYGLKGEKNHLPIRESDFKYNDFIRAIKDYKVKGCIICESPILEQDALFLKELYYKL